MGEKGVRGKRLVSEKEKGTDKVKLCTVSCPVTFLFPSTSPSSDESLDYVYGGLVDRCGTNYQSGLRWILS